MKNVLIVYAHAEKTSFNAALRDVVIKCLTSQDHNVVVSDLYDMKFNPVATRQDIIGEPSHKSHFEYPVETGLAWREGRLSEDIVEEQNKLKQADLVVFQFPLYWLSMPAILKGWFDRIMLEGFAFTETENYDMGHMKGKKALLSLTTGVPMGFYTPVSQTGDINVILWPIVGNLRFLGFTVLEAQVSWAPSAAEPEARQQMLQDLENRLRHIWEEAPLQFTANKDFVLVDPKNPSRGIQLKDDLMESSTVGLSPGQHLGKILPENFLVSGKSRNGD